MHSLDALRWLVLIPLLAQLENIPREYVFAAAALGGLVLLIFVVRLLRRSRRPRVMPPVDLTIDVADLGDEGPPRTGPQLELYNVPVRLSALIIAPTGRGNELDPDADMADVTDHIVHGLGDFIHLHQPIVRLWPSQLSTRGFANTLATNVRLPGGHGKGSPWSTVAGRFEADGKHYVAGLIVCADDSNNLGQLVVERQGGWLDMLRVRSRT
jgi:hypothetical protein